MDRLVMGNSHDSTPAGAADPAARGRQQGAAPITRFLGSPGRCFVIAEAGVNHNGSLERALEMVDVAAEAGADAVKFQTFKPSLLVHQAAEKGKYQQKTTSAEESQFDMLAKLELSADAFRALRDRCVARGIMFLSTPFDEESAALLAQLDVAAYKLSSADITNLPLIASVAATGRPVILSTGMSELAEIDEAVAAARGAGCRELGLLHCVSAYPTPADECNLRVMAALRERYEVPVGFSDHTPGIHIASAAVALGAEILEKHFTLDRALPGPDHAASLNPTELRQMIANLREVESAFGDGVKRPTASESENLAIGRRSLHWSRAAAAGETASASDFVALRPGTGLPPGRRDALAGRRLTRSVQEGDMVCEEDFA
jgi:N,N'-diacetyllegionaminate synthase